ncbi:MULTISPECIES: hypothetical protein [Pectobacterium]|uniref:hypothetical protein n=1 Tax=Pectobacterium TaxID=122277 RepID=UPI00027E0A85|nr:MULTISPECIES: hypothetical protein [Pectobacterium]GKW00863.1 hypothetical protein PEC301653_39080 [Pectobacterium carotovorum subsp. carotovorum]AFR01529.1 hypothetical protein PCC21_001260 [Pectobacterium carotovorum subsp. carotovorum PCC21]KHT16122.1 hypothetical protein RC95_15565 [Pectobacterium brasiliense]MBN3057712.1 hypothetical protein [Pectobacterium brasiliense]MDY4382889.1 hypothetical protein [Pectobacterium brasiliense]
MQASEYLKYKMESDKVLATHLDDITKKLKSNTISLTTDLYNGMERTSWYASCLFEKYNDVCEELKFEDRRMFFAIVEIYKREDVILDMIKIYVDILMKNFDEHKQLMIAKSVLGTTSEVITNRAIKESISYLLAKSIASSFSFGAIVRKNINKYSLHGITLTAFYGKVQKASMSARHLRDINPPLYWSFYSMKVEMLYFLIEPVLPAYILISQNNETEVINFINGIIKQ